MTRRAGNLPAGRLPFGATVDKVTGAVVRQEGEGLVTASGTVGLSTFDRSGLRSNVIGKCPSGPNGRHNWLRDSPERGIATTVGPEGGAKRQNRGHG